ncbi:hypothetical protein BRADI_1g43975v3 [Brachypodium distachyon]|uniref:Secreted protein n=1 Tax=Brachypodium distachyon TaxID=15368 RepID=A0A2K2DP85_BRADI|nr:hypothetical protein BRADI_1g43975v3 [Brachypodium distachyon]
MVALPPFCFVSLQLYVCTVTSVKVQETRARKPDMQSRGSGCRSIVHASFCWVDKRRRRMRERARICYPLALLVAGSHILIRETDRDGARILRHMRVSPLGF